jgi:hypothetical protein
LIPGFLRSEHATRFPGLRRGLPGNFDVTRSAKPGFREPCPRGLLGALAVFLLSRVPAGTVEGGVGGVRFRDPDWLSGANTAWPVRPFDSLSQ